MERPSLKTVLSVTVAICFMAATVDSIVLNRPLTAELVAPLMTLVLISYLRNGNGKDKQ